ncbi:astacin-like metalloprotease toxin 2 [Culex pipiens pallens]|uniref:astacin-like metalloprotease toxin 2 n=1 Tax=Culex pipiens pallens TaxID=42434 RepID=UPI0022AAA0FC|nr:astacin-like metalloprotease toxin 2 [Culex pipiens pallens]
MKVIALVSCIKFVERANQVGYVDITSEDSGCWADSGYQSTRSQLNLGPTCATTLGTPLHELMHVLGFLHQHTRPDRDLYVEVLYENVIQRPELLFNFEIIEPWTDTGFPLPYDYDSIMHYTPRMFSRDPDRLETIRARNPKITNVGQRERLSELDVQHQLHRLTRIATQQHLGVGKDSDSEPQTDGKAASGNPAAKRSDEWQPIPVTPLSFFPCGPVRAHFSEYTRKNTPDITIHD